MKKILFFIGIILIVFLFRYNIAAFIASQNSETLLEYYQYLLKKNPEQAYKLCISNLENKNTEVIATSYDTLNEMTIPEAMIFYANQKNAFSKEQMKNIYDWIFKNLDENQNLAGVLSVYLYDNEKNPEQKYYPYLKKEIIRMTKTPNDNNFIYFNYFYNYKKDDDSGLYKHYIEKAILEEKNHYNFTLETIVNNPRKEYFPILKMFYEKKIKGKTFRSDDSYFELEQFTTALIKYQNPESKEMLKEIAFNTKYKSNGNFISSNGNFISSNEQIYLLLKEKDTSNYFSDITEKLAKRINNKNLQKIIEWNNWWNNK